MKGNPIESGGSLASKPTWSNTSGFSTTSAFFRERWHRTIATTRDEPDGPVEIQHGAAGRPCRERIPAAENGPRPQSGDGGPESGHAGGHAARGLVASRE